MWIQVPWSRQQLGIKTRAPLPPPPPTPSHPCVQTLEPVHLLYFWWSLSKVQTVIYCCSITSAHSYNDYSLSSLSLTALFPVVSLSLPLFRSLTHTYTRMNTAHSSPSCLPPVFLFWHRVYPQSPVRTQVRINNVNRTPPAASTEWWLRHNTSPSPHPSVSNKMSLFANNTKKLLFSGKVKGFEMCSCWRNKILVGCAHQTENGLFKTMFLIVLKQEVRRALRGVGGCPPPCLATHGRRRQWGAGVISGSNHCTANGGAWGWAHF